MNLNTLNEFRHAVYGSLRKANDALFNLIDALLSEDRTRSFPELSLSSHFERKWPSLYASLKDGDIDQDRLRKVFVAYLPQPPVGPLLWLAIDASGIAQPKAVTSPDRSAQLVLARDLVEVELRPWENKQRLRTPQQVRRAMSKLLPQLGTPARPPHPRGKSPGRVKGTQMGRRTRFPVVKQQPQLPPLTPK